MERTYVYMNVVICWQCKLPIYKIFYPDLQSILHRHTEKSTKGNEYTAN